MMMLRYLFLPLALLFVARTGFAQAPLDTYRWQWLRPPADTGFTHAATGEQLKGWVEVVR